jgi:hypothetical protein
MDLICASRPDAPRRWGLQPLQLLRDLQRVAQRPVACRTAAIILREASETTAHHLH